MVRRAHGTHVLANSEKSPFDRPALVVEEAFLPALLPEDAARPSAHPGSTDPSKDGLQICDTLFPEGLFENTEQ